MRNSSRVLTMLALGGLLAVPATAQSNEQFWKNTWFWGAQAGTYIFSAGGNQEIGAGVGGHWFITADHTALNLSFDQLLFTGSQVALASGQQVNFSRAQRFSATVYAMPNSGGLQLFVGGGFGIEHVSNTTSPGPFASPQQQFAVNQQIEQLATKAFLILGGGLQWRWFNNWVLFGQYQFQPSTSDFLISSGHHIIQGGIRYALTTSKEAISASGSRD